MIDDELLEEILKEPGEDGPRLAYAEVLASRGDPRAELIRLQCATLGAAAEARARELIELHRDEWLKGVQLTHGAAFRRGFVEGPNGSEPFAAVWSLRDYLDAAENILRTVLFAHVRLDERDPERPMEPKTVSDALWDELAHHRILARWRRLDCHDPSIDADRLRTLLASPHLRRLEALAIHPVPTLEGLRAIASAESVTSLRELGWGGGLGDRDVNLDDHWDGDEAIAILAGAPALALTSFGAPGPISDRGLALLAGSRLVRGARTLHLAFAHGASGRELARLLSRNEGPLRQLVLEGPVSQLEDGTKELSRMDALRHLQRLEIEGTSMTDRGLAELVACLGPELHSLALDVGDVSVAGLESLLASSLPDLDYLGLRNLPEDEALRARFEARFPGFAPVDE